MDTLPPPVVAPTTAWWYVDRDNKVGPVTTDELKRLLQSGKIWSRTLLWREGMNTWRHLDEIEELSGLEAVVPPPLPPQDDSDPLNYPLATRWTRFFARIFDVWWETNLIAALVVYFFPGSSAALLLFLILGLPVALILDAVLYCVAGNTPGKALLGLKVRTLEGESLSFDQCFTRNLSMWASGFAFGIPIIQLFTMTNQAVRLGKGQQASYDEFTEFRVRSKPSGWVRKIIFGFAFAGLLVITAVLNRIMGETWWLNLSTAQESVPAQQAQRITPESAKASTDSGQSAQPVQATPKEPRITPESAKAIEDLQQALRIDPKDDVWILYRLGSAYRYTGQTEKVTEVYRRLQRLDPAQADKFSKAFMRP